MTPPTAEKQAEISYVRGSEGDCLYLGDYRICGPKPWGGGEIIKTWKVNIEGLREGIKRLAPTGTGKEGEE